MILPNIFVGWGLPELWCVLERRTVLEAHCESTPHLREMALKHLLSRVRSRQKAANTPTPDQESDETDLFFPLDFTVLLVGRRGAGQSTLMRHIDGGPFPLPPFSFQPPYIISILFSPTYSHAYVYFQ